MRCTYRAVGGACGGRVDKELGVHARGVVVRPAPHRQRVGTGCADRNLGAAATCIDHRGGRPRGGCGAFGGRWRAQAEVAAVREGGGVGFHAKLQWRGGEQQFGGGKLGACGGSTKRTSRAGASAPPPMPGAAEAVPGGSLWPGGHPGARGRLPVQEGRTSPGPPYSRRVLERLQARVTAQGSSDQRRELSTPAI